MPGAIIPNDWDGVTFNCAKVYWPASVRWRAILFGQITEPERSSFWDPDSGDIDDAMQAIVDAEGLTEPDFWEEDCDVIPGHPISAFLAYSASDQVLSIGSWQTVVWATLLWNFNNSGFNLFLNGHDALTPDKPGWWHYDVQLQVEPASAWKATRAVLVGTGQQVARMDINWRHPRLSFNHKWGEGEPPLVVQVYTSVAATVRADRTETWFSGHYLGPVS